MRTWLTILSIKLGIVKLVCVESSIQSIPSIFQPAECALLEKRMNDLGLFNKDLARALGCGTWAIWHNIKTGRGRMLNKIDRYIKQQEKKR